MSFKSAKKYKLFLIAFQYATDFSVGSNIVFVNAKSNFRKYKQFIKMMHSSWLQMNVLHAKMKYMNLLNKHNSPIIRNEMLFEYLIMYIFQTLVHTH